jgi:hypothetical protein
MGVEEVAAAAHVDVVGWAAEDGDGNVAFTVPRFPCGIGRVGWSCPASSSGAAGRWANQKSSGSGRSVNCLTKPMFVNA